ncbi:MAG TPA: 50S ribosomal protein L23 [Candidatus Saccharimonadales bacterium]|nr:50S ribosomal protein L23 [Candidatus Saccharimonadales bacterium]
MNKTLVLRPRISEKTYGQSKQLRTYTFSVPSDANKHTVAAAITAQFSVTVSDIRIATIQGKRKRTVRKGGRAIAGQRSTIKKAYVTLASGDSLPVYATLEKAEANEQKAAKKAAKEKK